MASIKEKFRTTISFGKYIVLDIIITLVVLGIFAGIVILIGRVERVRIRGSLYTCAAEVWSTVWVNYWDYSVDHLIRNTSFEQSKVYFANTKCKEDTCDPGYKCIQDSIFSSACQECDDGFVGIACKYKNCAADPEKCKNGGICHDRSQDNWLPDVDPAYCQCPDPLFVGLGLL